MRARALRGRGGGIKNANAFQERLDLPQGGGRGGGSRMRAAASAAVMLPNCRGQLGQGV